VARRDWLARRRAARVLCGRGAHRFVLLPPCMAKPAVVRAV
jgi:hypothetical protein